MRKKIIAGVLLATMIFSLTACGSQKEDLQSSTNTESSSVKENITTENNTSTVDDWEKMAIDTIKSVEAEKPTEDLRYKLFLDSKDHTFWVYNTENYVYQYSFENGKYENMGGANMGTDEEYNNAITAEEAIAILEKNE